MKARNVAKIQPTLVPKSNVHRNSAIVRDNLNKLKLCLLQIIMLTSIIRSNEVVWFKAFSRKKAACLPPGSGWLCPPGGGGPSKPKCFKLEKKRLSQTNAFCLVNNGVDTEPFSDRVTGSMEYALLSCRNFAARIFESPPHCRHHHGSPAFTNLFPSCLSPGRRWGSQKRKLCDPNKEAKVRGE